MEYVQVRQAKVAEEDAERLPGVPRARRTLKHVIDNGRGLVDPANRCRCGKQIAAGEEAGILRRYPALLDAG